MSAVHFTHIHDNGFGKYGYFDDEAREFVITRPDPPRPWFNYAWSPEILCSIDQRGEGECVRRDADGNRTVASDKRFVYLRDRATGEFWTLGWGDIRLAPDAYRCRHGLGFTVLSCHHQGIQAQLVITAAPDHSEIWQLAITNESGRVRQMDIFAGVRLSLGGWVPYGTLENYARGRRLDERMLFGENRSNERAAARNQAGFATERTPVHSELSQLNFLGGAYGEWRAPAAVAQGVLSDGEAMNEALVGVFQFDLELAAESGRWENHFKVFCARDEQEARTVFLNFNAIDFTEALAGAAARTLDFERVNLTLPDTVAQEFFNVWAKQQLLLVKDYARIFLMGFRDTLQDAETYAAYDPAGAAASIRRTLRHQYRDGSAMRGWCPDDTHRYADSGVWLAMTLAEYLRETGDRDFLTATEPYCDDDTPGSILDHLETSLAWFEKNLGAHGLPKLYFGDWNDSLNIGRRGRGESVWLAMALVKACCDATEIAEFARLPELARQWRSQADKMRDSIEKTAWDGEWYLRGFDDDGRPVGSRTCSAGRIFSEPQSWCALAGLDPKRVAQAADSARRLLYTPNGFTVCTPAFHDYDPALGRISCILPGWGENGSCYCHVTAFQAAADALRGDGNAAWEELSSILPFHAGLSVETSKLEPYAFTNMYRGPENLRPGETFKGWTSGTVAWGLRTLTHCILGVRPEFDGLRIAPALPDAWQAARMERTFRNARCIIDFKRIGPGGNIRLFVNRQPLAGTLIPLAQLASAAEYRIEVQIG